jgi:hypothetical protein
MVNMFMTVRNDITSSQSLFIVWFSVWFSKHILILLISDIIQYVSSNIKKQYCSRLPLAVFLCHQCASILQDKFQSCYKNCSSFCERIWTLEHRITRKLLFQPGYRGWPCFKNLQQTVEAIAEAAAAVTKRPPQKLFKRTVPATFSAPGIWCQWRFFHSSLTVSQSKLDCSGKIFFCIWN